MTGSSSASRAALRLPWNGALIVCGIVEFELQYLREIGRITPKPTEVFGDLAGRIGLAGCQRALFEVAAQACEFDWTRGR